MEKLNKEKYEFASSWIELINNYTAYRIKENKQMWTCMADQSEFRNMADAICKDVMFQVQKMGGSVEKTILRTKDELAHMYENNVQIQDVVAKNIVNMVGCKGREIPFYFELLDEVSDKILDFKEQAQELQTFKEKAEKTLKDMDKFGEMLDMMLAVLQAHEEEDDDEEDDDEKEEKKVLH